MATVVVRNKVIAYKKIFFGFHRKWYQNKDLYKNIYCNTCGNRFYDPIFNQEIFCLFPIEVIFFLFHINELKITLEKQKWTNKVCFYIIEPQLILKVENENYETEVNHFLFQFVFIGLQFLHIIERKLFCKLFIASIESTIVSALKNSLTSLDFLFFYRNFTKL